MAVASSSKPVITTIGTCGATALACATVSDAVAVGQRKVQQIASNGIVGQAADRLGHQFHVRHVERLPARFGQRCAAAAARRPRCLRPTSRRMGDVMIYLSSGSLTTVSQKSSIDFTTSMKRLKSTGLVM